MVVYKFGGATTRAARGLETLVDLVRAAHAQEMTRARRPRRGAARLNGLIVIVSAIGHTTRYITRAIELAATGSLTGAEENLEKLLNLHEQLVSTLALRPGSTAHLQQEFHRLRRELSEFAEGIAITREVSRRVRDQVLGYGEQFALAIIEILLQERGTPVGRVDARDIMVTNENFGRALPMIPETTERVTARVVPLLERSLVVLTQGFVGATRDGIPTTMGSESSDLTATVLARAVGALEIVIWKTVAGIHTADPELIPSAKLIKDLTFREADEIGRRGARVLFERVGHPIEEVQMNVRLRVASPRTIARTSTSITLEHTGTLRKAKPLALAIEPNLISLKLQRRLSTLIDRGHNRSSAEARRREEAFRNALEQASYFWTSGGEMRLLVKKDAKGLILSELQDERYELVEGGLAAAVSLVFRRPFEQADYSHLQIQMIRSLRSFNVRALFPVENSLVAVLNAADAASAMKKLHRDIFGR